MQYKTIVIVPSFREEKNITHVIENLKRYAPFADILIIDDGSKDRTGEIAENEGVKVIKHPFNMGYGVTIQTGYKYAVRNDYDILIQFDGDGQHDARFIEPMIDCLTSSDSDVVIGSRFLEGGSYNAPIIRKLGISLFSKIASLATGLNITDSTSGLQALNKKAFTFYSNMNNFPYDYPDADTIITLHYAGLKVKEVPVKMHDRMAGKSMTAGLKSLIYVTQMLISIFITLIRKKKIATASSLMLF
jgi:glycosyltransferase involved in cell wall biosynthesis